MATDREKRHALIKQVVTETKGSVTVSAKILGCSVNNLSLTLNSGMREWWTSFKRRMKLDKDRERHRRWYANRQRRALEAAGLDPDSYQAHKSS